MIHLDLAEKERGLPSIKNARGCKDTLCPKPKNFEHGFGLAGGGYGTYVTCPRCRQIRGKDTPKED